MVEDRAPGGADDGNSRTSRVKVSELASVELPDGRTIGVRIRDVSASGFRMETPEPLEVGIRFMLLMRRYDPVPAEIRWSLADQAGAAFLESSEGSLR